MILRMPVRLMRTVSPAGISGAGALALGAAVLRAAADTAASTSSFYDAPARAGAFDIR